MEKLSVRRKKLCLKFAVKAEKHPEFSKWFKPNRKLTITRQVPTKYCEVFAVKNRFKKSPLSYMTNLLNNLYHKKLKTNIVECEI